MTQRIQRIILALFVCLLVFQFVLQIRHLLYNEETVTTFKRDDTFYYLNIAWNLKEHGFVTFDGIHSTNGVQFFWYWILAGVAFITPTKTALLYATSLLTILINALNYRFLWRIGITVERRGLSLTLALFLFFLNISSRTYIISMENSLHLLVMMWLGSRLLDVIHRSHNATLRRRDIVELTFIMSLNVWTRIDAIIYVVPIYVYCLWIYTFRNKNTVSPWTTAILSGSIALIMALVLFGGLFLMGGTFLPVSGEVKQQFFYEDILSYFDDMSFKGFLLSNPVLGALTPLKSTLFSGVALHKKNVLFFGLILVLPYLWLEYVTIRTGRSKTNENKQGFRSVVEMIAVIGISIIPWLLYMSGYPSAFINYLTPVCVFAVLISGLCLYRSVWLAAGVFSPKKPFLWGAPLIMLIGALFLMGQSLDQYSELLLTVKMPREFNRYGYAQWLDDHLEQDAKIGSWNAGIIGYYSNRPTINLDGVVNTQTYYDEVLKGKVPLIDYLEENGITYLTDVSMNPEKIQEGFVEIDIPDEFGSSRLFYNAAFSGGDITNSHSSE